jgi:hypothetical protein
MLNPCPTTSLVRAHFPRGDPIAVPLAAKPVSNFDCLGYLIVRLPKIQVRPGMYLDLQSSSLSLSFPYLSLETNRNDEPSWRNRLRGWNDPILSKLSTRSERCSHTHLFHYETIATAYVWCFMCASAADAAHVVPLVGRTAASCNHFCPRCLFVFHPYLVHKRHKPESPQSQIL